MTPTLARDLALVAAAEAKAILYDQPEYENQPKWLHGVAHPWRERGQEAAIAEAKRLNGVAQEWRAIADNLETPTMKRLALIDFSYIMRRHLHARGDEPTSNATRATIDQIRAIASGFDHVAICLDSPGKNWRHELAPSYKANREGLDELSKEQIRRAEAQLRADGFAMLAAPGFEADDVIATACAYDFGPDAPEITIVSGDKDLMQLASKSCRVLSVFTNAEYGPDEVKAKFGVAPAQMGDFLALVGDKSDNVPGVQGVGPKRASDLLQQFSDLTGVRKAARTGTFTPAISKAFAEAEASGQLDLSRELVSLCTDAPIDILAAFAPRNQQPTEEPFDMNSYDDADNDREMPEDNEPPPAKPEAPISAPSAAPISGPSVAKTSAPAPQMQRQAEPARAELPYADPPAPQAKATEAPTTEAAPAWHSLVDWDKRYEPKTRGELWKMSEAVVDSALFSGFGRPSQVMLVLMAGAEFGLGTMASLRSFHIVENKPTMSAQLMMAIASRHPECELFRVMRSQCTNDRAVVWIKKRGWTEHEEYTWTIEDAKRAGLLGKNNWQKYPRAMLIDRAISEAARFTFPELMANCYIPDEVGSEAA